MKHRKNLMKRIRRRLDRYVTMEVSHCGHEGPMVEAMHERDHFLDWLELEIETREKSAIAEDITLNRGPG